MTRSAESPGRRGIAPSRRPARPRRLRRRRRADARSRSRLPVRELGRRLLAPPGVSVLPRVSTLPRSCGARSAEIDCTGGHVCIYPETNSDGQPWVRRAADGSVKDLPSAIRDRGSSLRNNSNRTARVHEKRNSAGRWVCVTRTAVRSTTCAATTSTTRPAPRVSTATAAADSPQAPAGGLSTQRASSPRGHGRCHRRTRYVFPGPASPRPRHLCQELTQGLTGRSADTPGPDRLLHQPRALGPAARRSGR